MMTGSAFEVTPLPELRSYKLSGELDLATVEHLREILRQDTDSAGDLTLDLSELRFIDSSGLRAIMEASKSMKGKDVVVLRNPSHMASRVLTIAGLDRVEGIRVVTH
jgi:anti-sigma B factor antagonist